MSEDDELPDPAGDSPPSLAARLGVALVVAAAVALGVGIAPTLSSEPTPGAESVALDNDEYGVENIAITQIPARGEVRTDVGGNGTVVFDRSHVNGYAREQIQPLVEAINRAGYDVVFHRRGELGPVLDEADAYVVVSPGDEFTEKEREVVGNFTEAGGRVVVFGEPNRIAITAGQFGQADISVDRTAGNRLVSDYGLTFRTHYVYNQAVNDGGYKNPIATPVGPAAGVGENVTVYTAAPVVSFDPDNEVLLRLPAGSRVSGTDGTGSYAVAVRSGNLTAVGDTSLLGVDRYNVADNEEFLAYLVEFLLSGVPPEDREPLGNGTDG